MLQSFALAFVAFAAVGTAIAIASRKMGVRTLRDYYVAGGRMGALLAFGAYAATTYSAFMMVGLVGLAYQTGSGALGFELLYLLSTVVLLATVGRTAWALSKRRGWSAPSQMLGDLYGSGALAKAAAIVYLLSLVPYTAAQIIGIGSIFEAFGVGYGLGVAVGAALSFAWLAIAGMWSVATTDLYQAIVMLAGGLAYFSWIVASVASAMGLPEAASRLGEAGYLGITRFWTPSAFLAYTIPWAFFAITNPQVVARLYVHVDEKAYRRSTIYFAFYGFLYTLLSVGVGLLARALALGGLLPGNLARDSVTPALLLRAPDWLSALVAVSIVAAALSTINGIVMGVSSSLVKAFSASETVGVAVAVDALLSALAGLLAYLRAGYIVDLSVLSSVLLLPFAPVTLAGLVLERERLAGARHFALAAIAVGALGGFAAFVTVGPAGTFTAAPLGLPVPAWILLASTLVLLAGLTRGGHHR
ncbi:MAG: sodium:solute symporter family protein [Desulfurococcaceae archaeon]